MLQFSAAQRMDLENAWVEMRWRQYAKDPALFFEECLFIPSQEDPRGRTRFIMYDHQAGDLDTFLANRFVAVLKGRQIGLSTLVGALALWRCLFHPGSVILWVSNNQKNADKAVNSLSVMWDFLPSWVKAKAPEKTSKSAANPVWTFEDGMTSRIRAYAGTATAGASETASIVILDEFALVDGHLQDDLLRSATPTTDAGGSLWMISTARGSNNRFARTYRGAKAEQNHYVPIFHPWMVSHFINPKAHLMSTCPECGGRGLVNQEYEDENGKIHRYLETCDACVDTSIYESKAREFIDKPWLIHAEYPATEEEAFRESGNPVFRDLPLEEECDTAWTRGFLYYNEDTDSIDFVPDDTAPLRVHNTVIANGVDRWREHVIFVDPAEGVGEDYTAAHVLTWDDDQLPTIVAWWHENTIKAVDAAHDFNLLGRFFTGSNGPALLAIETQGGWGTAMLTELNIHERYQNLYVHVPSDARRKSRAMKLGFPMSWQKRPMVIEKLAHYMRYDTQVGGIHPLLRSELATFVQNEAHRLEADVGCHDDLVMSLAGGIWVLIENTKATERPTVQEETPLPHIRLKHTQKRVQQALRDKDLADAQWEATLRRRANRSKRFKQRRNRRARQFNRV